MRCMKKTKRVTRVLLSLLLILATMFSGWGSYCVLAEGTDVETPQSDPAKEEKAFEYLYVEKPYITTPDTQRIVLSLKDGATAENGILFYKNQETGETGEIASSQIEGEAILFEKEYVDTSESGIYSLTGAKIVSQGKETEFSLEEEEVQGKFGVNRSVETQPDAYMEEDGAIKTAEEVKTTEEPLEKGTTEVTVASENAEGEIVSDSVVGSSVEDVSAKIAATVPAPAPLEGSKRNIVIVLDPGHGGGDPGAAYFGETEKNLALKIARYCKAALEQCPGVKVYMTRDSDRWVGNGVTNANADLAPRVAFAKSVNADIFVSLHLNATGTGAGKGAEIYYPAGSYGSDAGTIAKGLAQSIQKELVALGLYDRGTKAGDIFHVVRETTKAGIAGILIEHAFLDNAGDYEKFLNSEEKLKKLGQADALGIIKYLNLEGGKIGGTWVKDGAGWWYRYMDNSYPVSQWLQIGGSWYYFNDKGYMHTGWLTQGSKTFYLQSSGVMRTDWMQLGNGWYYFAVNGEMAAGWLNLGGDWYYMNPQQNSFGRKGVMRTGIVTDGGARYYMNPQKDQNGAEGAMRTGWVLDKGKWYYFNPGVTTVKPFGAALTDWVKYQNAWYYLESDGSMKTGWLQSGTKWYYLLPSGEMATGPQNISGKTYRFNDLGEWITEQSKPQTGWKNSGKQWYYYDEQGRMAVGWLKQDGKWYYLNPTDNAAGKKGVMRTGWVKDGNAWYYLNPTSDKNGPEGAMCTGIVTEGGNRYYLNQKADQNGAEGIMRTGWILEKGNWYYFNPGTTVAKPVGAALTGWIEYQGSWYYMNTDGTMKTGWLELGGKKYYLLPTGEMATGTRSIDGKTHIFNASGEWQKEQTEKKSGWKNVGDDWYYYNAQGVMQTGWIQEGGAWYYLNKDVSEGQKKGVMRTGWFQDGTVWYYLNTKADQYGPRGAMRTGWLEQPEGKYYLNPGNSPYGPTGAMCTGWIRLGEMWYYLNQKKSPEGLLTFTGHSIMGKTGVTVEQMVKMYAKSGRNYPAEKLSAGNAPTIRDFCRIVYEEAEAEGVKAEVVFAQAMKETGYLQFGGDVKIEQFNFAGLGATGNGVSGERFADVRTGVRAQVQHLKAYASAESLKNTTVDKRFQYVSPRGSAPCVEALGIQDNPAGRMGWAMAKGYGFSLYSTYLEPMYSL